MEEVNIRKDQIIILIMISLRGAVQIIDVHMHVCVPNDIDFQGEMVENWRCLWKLATEATVQRK